jgi:hypothetical protein
MTRRTSSTSFDVSGRHDGEAPSTQDSLLLSQGDDPQVMGDFSQQEKTQAYIESQKFVRDSDRKINVGWKTPALMAFCYIIGKSLVLSPQAYIYKRQNQPGKQRYSLQLPTQSS